MSFLRGYSGLRRINPKVIDIRNVRLDQYPEALAFMRRYFFDDPLLRAMGISYRHDETQKFLSALWLTLLRCGVSLSAVHRNKICGLCINCPHTHSEGEQNDILLRLAKAVKTIGTRNLLLSWDKITREVYLPVDDKKKRIMELSALAVGFQFRQLGLGRKLIQSSADYARLLGYNYVRVDCTSPFTAKICDRLGWQKIMEIPFSQFEGIVHDVDMHMKKSVVQVYFQPLCTDNDPA